MLSRYRVIVFVVFIVAVLLSSTSTATLQTHESKPPSPAANIAGRYRVVGMNPDGGQYTGSLEVIPHGGVFQFRWNAGSQYDGVGVRNGRTVAVAFTTGSDGRDCGVVNYNILSDGGLEGRWGYWGMNGNGTETAKHISGNGLSGTYAATGTNQDGTRYQVNISVQETTRGYKFAWSNGSEGFGIRRADNLAVGIGGEKCGFVAYEIKADGSLDGVWGGYGSEKTGTEKATKQ